MRVVSWIALSVLCALAGCTPTPPDPEQRPEPQAIPAGKRASAAANAGKDAARDPAAQGGAGAAAQ